ncbi:hypothetical protein NLG97_g7928 [Lecanicillium saksenae]|uniref:Uncharacterized protein n=1 Tax=Lecanicillium saksenae TaxID=468837 RepID=A0ACC1QNM9_9HYPO|nr:hypothetical protein NLG97_g7928 [Lecanicillium saksenae]
MIEAYERLREQLDAKPTEENKQARDAIDSWIRALYAIHGNIASEGAADDSDVSDLQVHPSSAEIYCGSFVIHGTTPAAMDSLDKSFGPRLFGHFDFTLLFEQTIFEITPAVIIIFVVPYYIFVALTSTPRVRFGLLLWCKLSLAAALFGLQINNAILWCTSPLNSDLASAAAICSCVSAICLGVILYAGHVFFLHSPSFSSIFLTVTMLLDIAVTRSYFQRSGLEMTGKVHIPIPVVKFVLVVLEEISKRSLIIKKEVHGSIGEESLAGFWNRSMFAWVNRTLFVGFRSKITLESLGDIGSQFDSEKLHMSFVHHWDKCKNKNGKLALLLTCFKTVPWLFLYITPPRLVHVGLQYAQPFLLQEVVKTVSIETPDPAVTSGLIAATAIVFFGKAIVKGWYNHFKNQIMTSIRSVLIGSIYHKSLKLDEGELGNAAAVSLMSTDVNGVERLITLCYESWARLLEVGAGIAILGKFIGPSCLLVLIPAVLSTICSARLAARLRGTRKVWNEHIEARVGITSNVLAQMKDVKMMGLAPSLAKMLQEKQDAEIQVSLRDRNSLSCVFALSALVETATPAIIIAAAIFTSQPTTMRIDVFFTNLAVVTMVTVPLAAVLGNLSFWATGMASIGRIQAYLLKDELPDMRITIPEETSGSSTNEDTPGLPRAIELRNRRRAPKSRYAIQMNNVMVALDADKQILRDVSVKILPRSKTMICGAVGSGKTIMLRALLGELAPTQGSIKLSSRRPIAYCAQVPWIRNDTIQNNVVGANMYNATRLRRVIWACALDVDIASLPNGILTICGSDGRNLSGGQKQRVALARALYEEAETTILDDSLSSLDTDTASTIRDRLFEEGGLLTSTTLIMTTNAVEDLSQADLILEMSDGRAQEVPRDEERVRARLDSAAPSATQAQPTDIPVVASGGGDCPDNSIIDRKYGDFSLYSYYLGPAGWRAITLWLVSILIAAVGEKMPQIYARLWLDSDPESRLYYVGFVILCIANPTLNLLTTSTFFYLVNPPASKSLHWKLADTTARATFDYIAKEDAGAILNRFGQDTSLVTQRLPLAILPASWMGLTVLMDVAIIASGATFAAPILPFFLLVVAGVQHFYLRTSRQLRVMELDTSKKLYKHFNETMAGAVHIRAYSWQSDFIAEFYKVLDETQKPFYLLFCVQQWLALTLDMTTAVSAVAVVSFAVKYTSRTSNTAMGLAFLSLITCSETANMFIQTWVDTETCLGGVARIRDFATTTPMEKDSDEKIDVPESWPEQGQIELRNVGAVYKTRSNGTHKVLENANATIKPRQTVAITGRTGSGKTSMLLALLNLIEFSGDIELDGIELGKVSRDILRSRITTITQSAVQLKGSVRCNLDPFDATLRPADFKVTDELLMELLTKVQLWDIIEARGGLDADLGDMGLSHGQKQLLQLARAMLHQQSVQSKIILVDEGSSSMDEETESCMQQVMTEVFEGCTILMVSHRPAAVRMADCVLHLAGGQLRVVRQGRGE